MLACSTISSRTVLDLNVIEIGGNGNDMKKRLDIEKSNLVNRFQQVILRYDSLKGGR